MELNIDESELLEYFDANGLDLIKLMEFYPRIFEPLGKPSQFDFTAREFFYWIKKEIIDIPKVEKGQRPWSKLNLIEILWIRIVQELRAFNLPFKKLVNLKSIMFSNALDELKNNREETNNVLKEKFKGNTKAITTANKLIEFSTSEKELFTKEFIHATCFITSILFDVFLKGSDVKLIIYKNKAQYSFIFEGTTSDNFFKEEIEYSKKHTHLVVNLRNLISEYLLEENLEPLNEKFGFISEDEKKLIKELRDKNVKEIHIKKNENEEIIYTTTKVDEIKGDQAKELKRILRMNEFDEVRAVLRNDKHIYIENKKKTKIRPVDTALKKKPD